MRTSAFPGFPSDLIYSLVLKYVSVDDLRALTSVCKSHTTLFNQPNAYNLWHMLLQRDFNFVAERYENPQELYKAIYLERMRLVTFTQVIALCESERQGMDVMDIFQQQIDLPHNNPSLVLSTALKFRQDNLFIKRAGALLKNIDNSVIKLIHDRINKIYLFLFTAEAKVVEARISELLPRMKEVFRYNAEINYTDEGDLTLIMLSLMSKCGAHHFLRALLSKLDVYGTNSTTKNKFLKYCGSSLCRDAAAFAHPNMLDLLLSKYDMPNKSGVPAYEAATYSDLFNNIELIPIASAISSLREICLSPTLKSLSPEQRSTILRSFNSVFFLLCHYGADLSGPRVEYSVGMMTVAVPLNGATIRDFAVSIKAEMQKFYLSDEEFPIIEQALNVIIHDDFSEYEDSDEEIDRSIKSARDEENDNSGTLHGESPKKKYKNARSDEENDVIFMASPEQPDNPLIEEDDQVAASPMRNAFRKLKF